MGGEGSGMAKKGVALVLGGSRGIGRGLAERLASEGYDVSLVARGESGLKEVAGVCSRSGANTLIFPLDVTNTSQLKQAVDQTAAKLGSIDVLICAVGMGEFAPFDQLPVEQHDRVIDVNYRSVVHATHYCMPYMGVKHNRGAIIYFSTTMITQLGFPGFGSYLGSKTGINGFAKSVFEEIRSRGVKVSNIYPAIVNSGVGNFIDGSLGKYNTGTAQDRLQVTDIVEGAMFVINASNTCCTCELVLQPQKQPVLELTKFTDRRPFPIPEPAIDKSKKVCLITGASKGIGRVIAERMAQHGYDLALVARSAPQLEEVANDCKKYGVRTAVIPTDLKDIQALERCVKSCVEQLGNLNVLINNAGVNRRRSALTAASGVWDDIIDTNFRAAIQITRAALPYMAQNTDGPRAVMYISSSVVLQPGLAGVAPYYATKHAVNGFVGGLFEDVRHLGIKVSTICPGLVNTELGTKKGPVENYPPELLIQCSDCADAVDYVLNSSDTCCPISMMIHPQAGVSLAITSMRKYCEEQFKQRSKL